ncbi:DUF6298 domain-containing protein [Segetibacter sp. 3557_3]|uniref:DUF6298 domain-containing protein n=1 Tax=Segetibacter sp. 3557_3 TaxID=2547429 RepID=UPI001A9D98AF|nr:DUF6298 domain-containing protein [Segetibacter sp. 3557_3]
MKTSVNILVVLCLLLAFFGIKAIAQPKPIKPPPPLSEKAGRLIYTPDSLGNRIPDFSYAGYKASNQAIPTVPVKVFVPLKAGDATVRIQAAIDYVASLPADQSGFKGAVLLDKGTYQVNGGLQIRSSGVVLRGSGMGANGTILFGAGDDRETLITISGIDDMRKAAEVRIRDPYVPVNANKFRVEGSAIKTGDRVLVHRPSTQKWIDVLGTRHFGGGIDASGWKPGQRDIFWDREVTAVNGDELTLDVPITNALDTTYGGGLIATYQWNGRINNVGIENLRCRSAYDPLNPKDEAHRWMAITINNVIDGWVRQVVFEHFAGSAVSLLEGAKRVTVEDCKSLSPVSEIGGERRYTFITRGQQTLFQRCYAENGYHDFSAAFCTAGPNAFVQCHSQLPYSFSGAIDSWSTGLLFDIVNVDGNALRFGNRGQDAQGAGWAAANSVLYQCTAAIMESVKPPTANNWAFGNWAQFTGDGFWAESNGAIQPRSLFYAQLAERLNQNVSDRAYILPMSTEASSSPPVSVAMELTAIAADPPLVLFDWIDQVAAKNKIVTTKPGTKTIDEIGFAKPAALKPVTPMTIVNGWLVRGDSVLHGRRHEVSWWRGNVQGAFGLRDASPHITRFVPGRTGTGLTDNLEDVVNLMKSQKVVALEHNYGLWYERRRDDHERIRRMNGEVWPPFYEQPFARSGKETAWDGLSKYDLTKYNKWYWSRLKKFADLADQQGQVLVHQNYFQHNIIEAGAHYADFPWRTANNINSTAFPEPPPYAGDKRIFLAAQFYDISNPARRELNKAYIRKCMDNFADNSGVIHLTSAEFTGPFHFAKFWINTIADWEKEKKKHPFIGLSATKDVQDSILNDPQLARTVDIIDIRYWHFQADGSAYAPNGGQNLAPRQHARLLNPKKTSFDQVYRAVREYRDKYPGKAVIYSGDSYDTYGWAVFMAGGSLPALPTINYPKFFSSAATMLPIHQQENGVKMLANKDGEHIVYTTGQATSIDLSGKPGSFVVRYINPQNGSAIGHELEVSGGKTLSLNSDTGGAALIWITKFR